MRFDDPKCLKDLRKIKRMRVLNTTPPGREIAAESLVSGEDVLFADIQYKVKNIVF